MNKLVLLLSVITFLFSDTRLDVLYLKNGSVIKGQIIENKINQYIKIEISGGSIFLYKYNDISSIEIETIKEEIIKSDEPQKKEIIKNEFTMQKENKDKVWPSSILLKSSLLNIDSDINDFIDPSIGIGLTSMINNQVELSLDYWLDYYGFEVYDYSYWYVDSEKFTPIDLGFYFHNNNLRFGLRLTDVFDDADVDNTGAHFVFGYYNDDLSWITVDHNFSYDDTSLDSPLVSGETSIELGKLWPINSSMMIGLSYTAGFDDLDQGFVGLSVGTYY